MTDPLGKTVEETGDKLITTKSKYNNNKQNEVIFNKKWKKYNEIQLTKNKMDLNIRKITNHPPSLEFDMQTFELWNSCTSVFPKTQAWKQ